MDAAFHRLLGRPQERRLQLTMRNRGFTLIELLIGLAIAAFLMLLALPSMTEFMANTRIRNTVDSIANGARQAQMEAIKRNRDVQFLIDPAVGWTINDPHPDLGGVAQAEPFNVSDVVVDEVPAGSLKATFTALGQFGKPNPDDATAPFEAVDVSSPAGTTNLRVVIDPLHGVGIRVCNPAYTFPADPNGCPATP